MGAEESTTYYAAAGRTFEEACNNLETLLRCHVDDRFRLIWVRYGKRSKRLAAQRHAEECFWVEATQNKRNKLHSAAIYL